MLMSTTTPSIFLVFAALYIASPSLAHAELFPDGLLGMRLGQTRVEALTALVNEGAVPDLEKTQCSGAVPERNRAVANRICKLSIQPGSTYMGLPLNKVSFLFQDEAIVLIGLDVGAAENTFSKLRGAYQARWGEALENAPKKSVRWSAAARPGEVKGTSVGLFMDTRHAFVVYSFDDVR